MSVRELWHRLVSLWQRDRRARELAEELAAHVQLLARDLQHEGPQRVHELGVRIALGARTGHVMQLVVGQGVAFGVAGMAIGVTLALLAAPFVQPLLFNISARDPLTYAAVGVVMLLVSLAASAVPAVRATRADPTTGLRSD